MPAGDLVTADHMYEFNGLALGPGTAYEITAVEGIVTSPRIRSTDIERPTSDGDVAGTPRYASRPVVLTVDVYGSSASNLFATALDALMDATVKQATDLPLVFQLPGWGKRRINCRPRERTAPIQVPSALGHLLERVKILFYAQDGRIYNNTETTTATAGTVTNAGNVNTYPTITVTAGATITNTTTSQALVTTGSGTLIIDTATRTVTKTGANAYDQVTGPIRFHLQPGANSITGTSSVAHRDAWV